ncbi:hypothetical protein DFJ74DRAFT_679794 [Hyaloraphidium curvatum]|nr:hypothetical protein DFJ74DRAFT_679794 [Hyaloraphidium curvatum]
MTASPARSISPHPSAPATPPKPRLPPPQPLLLSSREFALCANLSLPPEQFVAAAVQLEDECKRSGGLREKDAAMLASWLPWTREQWEGFWGFLLRHRYVWLRPKKRGADGKEAESEDEGGLFPAVPFYRLPEADNGKLDVSDLLFSASGAASEASDDVGRRWGGRTGRYGGGVRMPAGVGRVPGRRIVNGSSGELVVQLADGSAVRMVCPDCGKIAFNNLQGFVNHARISHGRYFPSHADAAVACGVPVGPEGAARARVRITDGPKPRAVPLGAPERPPVAKLEFNTRRMLAAARRAGTPDVGSEAGYGELRVRRADGTLARMVCPACGLSTFPDMPSFAAHLQDHGLQLGDPDAYAQPLALPGKKGRRGAAGRDAPALPGGPRARPTPRPLEISELPGYAELEPDERELCSHLRLFPESFMALKKLFTERCREQNGLGKRAARESVKMDVNKSSKVWEFLQERGLVWPPGGKPL